MFVVNLGVLVALLVPVELVFGTWVRSMGLADLKRFSIPIGVRFDFDTSRLYPGGGPIHYSRDEWGLRGTHSMPAQVDVLTVGGSTTEQRYLDDAATWQAVAERDLSDAGTPLIVANAGVDGQSTVGHIFNFKFWFPALRGLRPRAVVFYVGTNDVLRRDTRAAFDASVDASSWQVRSATFQLLRTVRNNWRARAVGVYHGRRRAVGDGDYTGVGLLSADQRRRISDNIISGFLSNVATLRQHTDLLGATPIFMTQTAFAWTADPAAATCGLKDTITIHGTTVNFADVSALHQELNHRLIAYCSAEGITCFDLARETKFDSEDYYDNLHNTPKGAAKIGHYLAARLKGSSIITAVR